VRKKARKKRRNSIRFSISFISFLLGLAVILALIFALFLPKFARSEPCANAISCIKDLSGAYEEGATGIFLGRNVSVPKYIASSNEERAVLGDTTNNESKHIYVDLTNQRLYAYEGKKMVFNFPVSTGKWYPTPTGDFRIWVKLRYTRMSGGDSSIGTYYNLPNVPFVMFFYNNEISKTRGFALHGAYWHNNFGHPMSHGCVNMRTEDVEKLYSWANPVSTSNTTYATSNDQGTLVTIYGVTPKE